MQPAAGAAALFFGTRRASKRGRAGVRMATLSHLYKFVGDVVRSDAFMASDLTPSGSDLTPPSTRTKLDFLVANYTLVTF